MRRYKFSQGTSHRYNIHNNRTGSQGVLQARWILKMITAHLGNGGESGTAIKDDKVVGTTKWA